MKLSIFLLTLIFITSNGNAQTVLLDENFSSGIPSTWSVFNEDQLSPDSSVAFVNNAWVAFTTSIDTCAVSTSYYSVTAGQTALSMDYLVTPQVDLLSFGHIFSWESKSFDANYPESYMVLLSTTDSLPDSFTDTVKVVNNDSPNWKTFSVNLFNGGFANQSVFIAIRNTSTDAYLLGIDNVKLTTDDLAGISDKIKPKIQVSPNPFTDIVSVSVPSYSKFEIINLSGQIVMSGETISSNLDLSILKSGMYFIKVEVDNLIFTEKIVKL